MEKTMMTMREIMTMNQREFKKLINNHVMRLEKVDMLCNFFKSRKRNYKNVKRMQE